MHVILPNLPVKEIFPTLEQALEHDKAAIVVAPPGAGKTTLIPLHLLSAPWRHGGMIIVLEPRRLAARAAARRMADILGEKLGETVGYRMRLDTKQSGKTRILVVTEGVFARMLLDDPELSGIAAVIFDEFHERSLDADFGLALTIDVREALRDDLRLIVMSATLDGARVAKLLDAPVIESAGRSFPVTIRYKPRDSETRLEAAMGKAILDALYDETGSILAFLPGQSEIERTCHWLQEKKLPDNVLIAPLYGALDAKAQDAAIRPTVDGQRKIVLATSIAETSLTIDGVRIVIDSGLSRLPVFEASTGLTRLETVRASRASVDQRAGRAGRTEAGIAIRLWHEGQMAALPAFTPPEILSADLTSFVLDCAAFGVHDPMSLRLLDPPPLPALQEAQELLTRLHALDKTGRITLIGDAMRRLALPVRLAHMVAMAAKRDEALQAAELAIMLSERGLGGAMIDLDSRVLAFRRDKSERAQKARALSARIAQMAGGRQHNTPLPTGPLLLDAWADRLGKNRGTNGQFHLANGRGAMMDDSLSLAKARYIVAAEVTGRAGQARILAAAEIDEAILRERLKDDIKTSEEFSFDPVSCSFKAKRVEKFAAITLSSQTMPAPKGDIANDAILQALRSHGLSLLSWQGSAENLRRRLHWLHQGLGDPWPDMSDDALLVRLDDWLLPFLKGEARFDSIPPALLTQALLSLVPYTLQRDVEHMAPTYFTVPTGSSIAIRYEGEAPVLSVRVQELFGLEKHPSIAKGTIPLVIELLSPAHRPIQITRDLPGFWQGSWSDVVKDMRGRYPKHVWPDNPLEATATRRAKPRNN